jgi:hypothetical protein
VADKVWMHVDGGIALDDVLSLPDLPSSVRAARAHFDRAKMDRIWLFGLDFTSHTINLYGHVIPSGDRTAADIAALLTGAGFPLPSHDELRCNTQAFTVYQTFNWDSPDLLRLCFPMLYAAAEFPTRFHPLLKTFVEQAPLLGDGRDSFGFYTTYGPAGGYYKVSTDYTGNHGAIFGRHNGPA